LQPRKKLLKAIIMHPALLHSPTAGELLAAEIQISPRLLEDLLDTLASAPFPLNPELDHSLKSATRVCFPIYEHHVESLREVLLTAGFAPSLLHVQSLGPAVSSYDASL